jgi:Tfp pilus assembly protein PilV
MSRTGRNVQGGAGLIDTLVALTLLAWSLLGAGTTLVRTLGADRAAALQTTAVDLAADLAEEKRSVLAPDIDLDTVQRWQRRVSLELPDARPPDQTVTASTVTVRWRDPALHRPAEFALDFAGAWPGGAP